MAQTNTIALTQMLNPLIANLYHDSNDKHALLVTDNAAMGQELKLIEWITYPLLAFITQPFDKQYQLACVVLPSEPHNIAAIKQSIQKCRDLFGKHCLVLLPIDSGFNLAALGFNRLTQDLVSHHEQVYEVWQFNLFDYKHLPDWLNSRFWANPENWNKYRW